MAAPRRALVTGAAGFVGANLVRRLLADGHEVLAILRPGASTWRLDDLVGRFTPLVGDLGDGDVVRALVAQARPEWIFHLAAHGAYSHQVDLDAMLHVNVAATAVLLEAAQNVRASAFVIAGSSSEYGYKDHAPREDELIEPNSNYAITKAAGTHLTMLAAAAGLPAAALRLYSVYGPWEEPGRLVPALVSGAREGRLPPLVSPETARDFVYVGDCCDAMVTVAANIGAAPSPPLLNLGSGVQTTLSELVEVVRRALGVEQEPRWGTMAQRAWDTSRWVADPTAMDEHFGWRARTGLEAGLTATAQWLEQSPALWPLYGSATEAAPAPPAAGRDRHPSGHLS
jgi:dolichol-phosphate mannosyltransferase